MLQSRSTVPVLFRCSPLVILMLSAGCITVPTVVEETATPPPPPAPVVEPPARPAPARPPPAPVPPKPVRTAVLLSDDIPVFSGVATALEQRLGNEHFTIHSLEGRPSNAARVLVEVADADRLVAVGLLAATVGRQSQKPLVFCKVFNYQDYDLISPRSKGVSLLPPFDVQLQAWTELMPELKSVGIITGPDQEALVTEIERASAQAGVTLSARLVTSDKEALVAFKRLTPEIQGLWLLPDNRILSPEVVREIMSYSAKHRKQIVVFGTNLLGLGGLMSVDSDDADVADQVLSRLARITADGQVAGPDMVPLTKMQFEINREVARHLGVDVSAQIARHRAMQ